MHKYSPIYVHHQGTPNVPLASVPLEGDAWRRDVHRQRGAPVLVDAEIVSRLRPYWTNALLRIDYTTNIIVDA
jgi:hypothetical protein